MPGNVRDAPCSRAAKTTPAKVTTHGGGSGANVAAWPGGRRRRGLLTDGAASTPISRNRDMELMGYGVDARRTRMNLERSTGTCVVMVTHKGERTMLSDPGANAALSPDDLPHDLFVPGAHLHVSGYTLLSEGSRAAALAALNSRRAGRSGMSHLGRRGVGRAARAGRAEPRLEPTGNALLLLVTSPRPGSHREDPRGGGRPRAHRPVPAGGHQAGRGRRAVLRQRPSLRCGVPAPRLSG